MQDGSNSYYVQPASVGHIRKFLFGLLGGTPQEAALAKSCLMAIDVLRDENGIAANDTRHPDVLSEIPWPPEAASDTQNQRALFSSQSLGTKGGAIGAGGESRDRLQSR